MASYRTSPLAATAPGVAETITRWSGQTMGGRVPAFMALAQRTGGTYLEREGLTVAEGLRESGLDFEVRLERTFAHVATTDLAVVDGEPQEVQTVTPIEVPDYRTTTMHFNDGRAPQPITPWVSPKYQAVQNTEAAAVGEAIISGGFGSLVAIGAWGRPVGAKTYMAFALDGMTVGGVDPVDLFLTVTNAHDGMGGLSFRLAPIRFACTNESPLYFGKSKTNSVGPVFTRRHTTNVLREAAIYAESALNLAATYREVFTAEAEKALTIKVTENQAITYWRQVFGVPADVADWSPRVATAAQEREDQLVSILASDTCTTGRRSAWGVFNAATEYMDHFAPARGADDAAQLAARQRRIVEGATDEAKQRAWNLALAI